jgi:CBS domain-containing protein
VQVTDVMTTEVVSVGPETSAKDAAELMVAGGFAALPVVDCRGRLVGIVAEADVLRDRLPEDPRLHLRRAAPGRAAPPMLVGAVMTRDVRSVEPTEDLSDVARLVVDEALRSVPVVHDQRLVGILSRRDLLRALVRPDESIRSDIVQLAERYTGEGGCWDVVVTDGAATIRRTRSGPDGGAVVEAGALRALAQTVGGVVAVRVLPPRREPAPAAGHPQPAPVVAPGKR